MKLKTKGGDKLYDSIHRDSQKGVRVVTEDRAALPEVERGKAALTRGQHEAAWSDGALLCPPAFVGVAT